MTARLIQHAFASDRTVPQPNLITALRRACSAAFFVAGAFLLYVPQVFADVKSAEQAIQQQRFADALTELQPLAKAGDTRAQADLGTLLMLG